MSDDGPQKKIIRVANRGVIQEMVSYLKLILRLMGDERVSPFLKLIPIGSLVYLVFPIDVPGPVDDAAVLGMSMYLFVELCPPDVVAEHRKALSNTIAGEWQDAPAQQSPDGDGEVIDAEYTEEK
jgi:uncharacterized membrane protein YkvA (DUF1232 family)